MLENPNSLFDYAEAVRLKEQGMIAAATFDHHREDWLAKARDVAKMLAMKNGEVNADDVQSICPRPANVPPAATGSLFRGSEWVRVGYVPTSKVSGHARMISNWRLK